MTGEFEVPLFEMDLPTLVAQNTDDGGYVPAACQVLIATLDQVRADLNELRAERDSINTRIKQRVRYEAQLERMVRIARELVGEEVRDGEDEVTGDLAPGAAGDVLD